GRPLDAADGWGRNYTGSISSPTRFRPMARRTRYEEDDPPDDWADDYGAADGEYDPEADWSPADEFLPGEAAEIPCPHCGAAITEDHQRCPKCEMFISREDEGRKEGRSWVWVVLMGLCLVMALLWAAGFM